MNKPKEEPLKEPPQPVVQVPKDFLNLLTENRAVYKKKKKQMEQKGGI